MDPNRIEFYNGSPAGFNAFCLGPARIPEESGPRGAARWSGPVKTLLNQLIRSNFAVVLCLSRTAGNPYLFGSSLDERSHASPRREILQGVLRIVQFFLSFVLGVGGLREAPGGSSEGSGGTPGARRSPPDPGQTNQKRILFAGP